jgi:ribonuclease HI
VKEIALCSFLDIEGAFDNTSYSSMVNAMKKRKFNMFIVNWIHTMLAKREITSELGGSSVTVRAMKGCPQGGVLSPLMWSLVVDEHLKSLEAKGFEVVGFADDIVILVRGRFDNVVSERMQEALNITQSWCIKEGLSINPTKVVIVPFTKKRKFVLKPLKLGVTEIPFSEQVKYLGVILDSKLNWTAHLDSAISKAVSALWLCSKTLGRKWGLKPKMIMWIYTAIIRPKITYASLVWWPKTKEATAGTKLAKLQRLACIAITGAMRSTPSKALDAILHLLPLHEYVQLEAQRSALRLKRCRTFLLRDLVGHMSILKLFKRGPVMNMNGDWMKPENNYDIPFKVCETSRADWEVGDSMVRQGSTIFFTDGSKIGTKTGAGIYGPGITISVAMGHWPTVFQAEIFAILECVDVCLRRKYKHANICIFSDSQAALKALCACKCSSKIVWECILSLRRLCQTNTVNLYWVPGHCGIEGNEMADNLAKLGSNSQFVGPEPFCGISNCSIKMEIRRWEEQKVVANWMAVSRCNQSKRFITPNVKNTKKLLELNKRALCTYTGLVTGHCPSKYHLKNIGRVQNDICRFCNLESETSEHLLCSCGALYRSRCKFLDKGCLHPSEIWSANPGKVIGFINHIIPDWERVGATSQSLN